MEETENRIEKIEARNKRVELDKRWETSLTRKICICVITYIIVVAYSFLIRSFDSIYSIFLTSLVPVFGFFLSTLSLKAIRKIWEKKIKKW